MNEVKPTDRQSAGASSLELLFGALQMLAPGSLRKFSVRIKAYCGSWQLLFTEDQVSDCGSRRPNLRHVLEIVGIFIKV